MFIRHNSKYGLLSMTFICVVVISLINYQMSVDQVLHKVNRESDEMLQRLTDEASMYVDGRMTELELMADYLSFIHTDDDQVAKFLSKQSERIVSFDNLTYISTSAKILTRDGTNTHLGDPSSLIQAFTKGVAFSSVFPRYDDKHTVAIRVAVNNYEGTNVVGAISGHINIGEMIEEILNGSNFPGTISLVADQKVIVSSSPELTINSPIPFSDIFLDDMEQRVEGSELVNRSDAHYIKFKQIVPNWYIVLDTHSEAPRHDLAIAFWRNYLFIALAVILFYIGYAVFRRFRLKKEHLLKQDILTGLSNRVQLEEDLREVFASKDRDSLLLILINIDRFKSINDRFGYQSGDSVLYELSRMMQNAVSPSQLYRVGGDEFVFTAFSNTDEQVNQTMDKILKSVDRPIILPSGESLWLTLSIGIREYDHGVSSDVLLKDAALAVQYAKEMGGNHYIRFTKELGEKHERSRLIAKNLTTALTKKEFHLVYQPLYRLDSRKITGYEALLRWNSQSVGAISPVEFVPILEETDLIIPVGRWVMQEVANTVNRWEKETSEDFQVAINISIKQLMHPEFINDVKAILNETSVSPKRLLFEITESIAVQNGQLTFSILKELNEIGIQTALDDFGTGYSSLSILKSLPIQHLKVDRSFIVKMENDGGKSKIILQGIIDIAKGLGMHTVMEGVETIEQLKILKEMGAEKIQGYLISKPVVPRKALKLREANYEEVEITLNR